MQAIDTTLGAQPMTEKGFLVLDEKDWEGMTPEQQSWAIYKTLHSLNARIISLENRTFMDKCFAFVGGIIGGFVAAVGMKYIGH